jgi:Flp pilus assembly protein TadG
MLVRRKRSESGSAIVELALMSPWLFFLFVGIMAFGFYMYAGICVQNAARVAAAQTSAGAGSATQAVACAAVLAELNLLPNSPTACLTSGSPTAASPLVVTQTILCGSTTPIAVNCPSRPTVPQCADCSLNSNGASSLVTVTYQSVKLIPIPGSLAAQLNFYKSAENRILVQ